MINRHWLSDLLLLFLLIGVFFIIGLGVRPYITPSEARYIEIPRQILTTGDWLTPHINGVKYFEKPPLFYWMQAVFLSFGNNEFWGRMATVLVVTLTCLVTYALGRMLYGRMCGILSCAALATSVMGYGLSHIAMLDAPVTLFLTCSIAGFLAAQKTGNKTFYYFMYITAALAVMTKGLIGIVIPGLVIGSWIVFTNNWKVLKEARLFSGILLFIAIAAPWHILMAMEHPEFLDFYFIHEHFTRFLTNEHKRTAPWWFFIAVTAVGAMPWLGAISVIPAQAGGSLYSSARNFRLRGDGSGDDKLFLLLWIFLPLIFFSISHSKLVPYIFPIFPPLFVLIGKRLADVWAAKKKLVIFIMAAMAMICIAVNYAAPQFDKRTIKPLAEILKPQLRDSDMVVAYDSYWQDLPVYLNRNIMVAGWTGELGFGVEHTPDAKNWMVGIESFWEKCSGEANNVYVFIMEKDFKNMQTHADCQLSEIARYGRTILLKKDTDK